MLRKTILLAFCLVFSAGAHLKYKYQAACVLGDPDLVVEMVNVPLASLWTITSDATEEETRRLDIISSRSMVLLEENDRNDPVTLLASFGHAQLLKIVLDSEKFNPALNNCFALITACKKGHIKCVRLLLKEPLVKLAVSNSEALMWASYFGHHRIVKLLLADGHCTSLAQKRQALRYSSRAGHVKVVRILLRHDKKRRGDFSAFSLALQEAATNNHTDVIRLFLRDGRADPSLSGRFAFHMAIKFGNNEAIAAYLEDPRIADLSFADFAALNLCVHYNQDEALCMLLKGIELKEKILYWLFWMACCDGHVRCASRLLAHPGMNFGPISFTSPIIVAVATDNGVDISHEPNYLVSAFQKAAENGHIKVIRLLIKDGRFEEAMREAVIEACSAHQENVVSLLFAEKSISHLLFEYNYEFLEQTSLIASVKANRYAEISVNLERFGFHELEIFCRCALSHGHISFWDKLTTHINSIFDDLSPRQFLDWMETLDYSAKILIKRLELGSLLRILLAFQLPLGNFMNPQFQEKIIVQLIEHSAYLELPSVATLLRLYLEHFAMMTVLDEVGLKDVWNILLHHQMQIWFKQEKLQEEDENSGSD